MVKQNETHRFTILEKEMLSPGVKRYVVSVGPIARKRQAGQFVIIRVHEEGERIPLTIVDANPKRETVTLVVQEVGRTTKEMGLLRVGDNLMDVVGPLGNPTPIEYFGHVVCIGGGVGTAVVYPIAKALKEAGNHVTCIIGARTQDLIILEEELTAICDDVITSTDDGSYGIHGLVTDVLQKLINDGQSINVVYAVGPLPMMAAVSDLTKPYGIRTFVSLNPIMVDGTGMCGGCRVRVGGKTKFACVDGPEFDGHQVDFRELHRRQKMYIPQERESLKKFEEEHTCRLETL